MSVAASTPVMTHVGIGLVREGRMWFVRVIGWVLPVATVLAVVMTANHYILDVVAGTSIVVLALVVATHVTRPSSRLRLSDVGETQDKALSRWEGPPQARSLEASETHVQGELMMSSYTPYVIERLTYRRRPSGLLVTSARRRRSSDGRADVPRAG